MLLTVILSECVGLRQLGVSRVDTQIYSSLRPVLTDAHMTYLLSRLAGGKLVVALEVWKYQYCCLKT